MKQIKFSAVMGAYQTPLYRALLYCYILIYTLGGPKVNTGFLLTAFVGKSCYQCTHSSQAYFIFSFKY
jgi:hypothetical protein